MEFPADNGESPIDVWIDEDNYVCLTDTDNDYEIAFSSFNWRALVEFVDQKLKERMS